MPSGSRSSGNGQCPDARYVKNGDAFHRPCVLHVGFVFGEEAHNAISSTATAFSSTLPGKGARGRLARPSRCQGDPDAAGTSLSDDYAEHLYPPVRGRFRLCDGPSRCRSPRAGAAQERPKRRRVPAQRPLQASDQGVETPGGVSERSKETVLKTVGPIGSRGFESHPLRRYRSPQLNLGEVAEWSKALAC